MTRQTPRPLERLPLNTGNHPITQLARAVERGGLLLDPEYQRGDVWSTDQRIALVYSLLVGATIPSITIGSRAHPQWTGRPVPSDGRGWRVVIDGRQRLTTIVMWLRGDFAVPASWFPADEVVTVEDTDDGPYVRYSGLTERGQDRSERGALLIVEGEFNSVAEEASVYVLLNGGGTPQTAADMARARSIAEGNVTTVRKPMKIYQIERRNGFVRRPVRDALGLAPHVQQVEIYIVAPTKAAARELVAATEGIIPSSMQVLVAAGNDAQAIAAAGLPGPAVYVYAGLGHSAPDRRVLRVDVDGSTHLVGHLEGHTVDATRLVLAGAA